MTEKAHVAWALALFLSTVVACCTARLMDETPAYSPYECDQACRPCDMNSVSETACECGCG